MTRLHIAYPGITTDHLYQGCPAYRRLLNGPTPNRYPDLHFGRAFVVPIDPLGVGVCGWCRSHFRKTEREEATK